jgi:transposase InsO family protein
MRNAGLLAPQRAAKRRRPRVHDGRIVTDAPNLRWGTDATMAWTREDGWVWVFVLIDHYTDEAWAHVAKVGNRFAALQPVYDAVIDRFGGLGPDVARGVQLRHDWGSQYRAHHFQGSLNWLGIEDDAAFVGEPQGSGVAERFIRTLKEQCLWARLCQDVDELRQSVATFITPTTASGSSNAWATAHHERRSTKRQLRLPRDSQTICPTNRGLNRWVLTRADPTVVVLTTMWKIHRLSAENGTRSSPRSRGGSGVVGSPPTEPAHRYRPHTNRPTEPTPPPE